MQSPLWQTDPGIASHEVAGEINERDKDTAAYNEKLHHNHPELTFDMMPTPFGEYDFEYSVRGGMLGYKVGKTTQIDDFGNQYNCYILWVPENHVIGHHTIESDGFSAITVGARNITLKEGSPLHERCIEAGVPPKEASKSFRITEDAFIPVGTKLDVRHFVPGQHVCYSWIKKPLCFCGLCFEVGAK